MRAKVTQGGTFGNINNFILRTDNLFIEDMFKTAGNSTTAYSFGTSDLLARANGGMVVPFTATFADGKWTYPAAFCGFCEYSTDYSMGDVRVITAGTLNKNFIAGALANVSQTPGTTYTMADFVAYLESQGSAQYSMDDFAYAGTPAFTLAWVNSTNQTVTPVTPIG